MPIKQKEAISKQYKEVVDELFVILRGSDRERKIENFKGRVASMREEGGRRFSAERERMIGKIRQMEADIQLWENNIGFFAKSKNAEALVGQVRKKIEQARADIAVILDKVKILDTPASAPSSPASSPSSPSSPSSTEPITEPSTGTAEAAILAEATVLAEETAETVSTEVEVTATEAAEETEATNGQE